MLDTGSVFSRRLGAALPNCHADAATSECYVTWVVYRGWVFPLPHSLYTLLDCRPTRTEPKVKWRKVRVYPSPPVSIALPSPVALHQPTLPPPSPLPPAQATPLLCATRKWSTSSHYLNSSGQLLIEPGFFVQPFFFSRPPSVSPSSALSSRSAIVWGFTSFIGSLLRVATRSEDSRRLR